jgi:serine/threonine protein kinase
MIGKTISHYRIIDKLGQGGMGEVYLAEDTNLNRRVAIKILPPAFSSDPEKLARFEREAKLLASLNHANIATIYGLEQTDGKRLLAMELVAGQTLAYRIARGPVPTDETLDVCCQIAEGLEAAHEKGIVHRDLKPSNVMVSAQGKVKILDFGLAKALAADPVDIDLTHSPTITEAMTRPGMVLGTAAYMSPEQAKGRPVDKRSDIWAFGCVLYECLTGRRAFQGETMTEVVASILKSEPEWSLLAANTPANLRSLLRRCLQKDPDRRLHDIADARIEMQEGVGPPSETLPVPPQPRPWRVVAGCTIALVIGLLIGAVGMKYFRPASSPVSQSVVRTSVRLDPGQWLDGLRVGESDQPSRTAMAISNNGRFIIYAAVKENPGLQDKSRLYMRRVDQLEAKSIPGTEGGTSPFLSPDDRWVGFWADGKLKRISVEAGIPAVLCNVSRPFGFAWSTDNQIIFAPEQGGGLLKIPAEGGKPEALTAPPASEFSHRLPNCLPDGKGILFTIMRHGWDLQPSVAVLEPGAGKWRILLEDAADARYIASGHLAFLRQGTLMLVPFDASRLEITGQPSPAIENIAQALNTGYTGTNTASGQFSISASGSLVFASGGILPDRENSLVWVDQQGNAEPIASFKAPFVAARLSPDGRRIAYQTLGKETQVWIYDLNRGTAARLTSEGLAARVTWTPDSRRVVFGWSKTAATNLYWQPADGSSPMERLATESKVQFPGSWSPDGEALAFVQGGESGLDVMIFRQRDRKIMPLLVSRFSETHPEFSPDGRWIAYVSDESGRAEVYVQPFPGPGGKGQISIDGGSQPLWSRNGRQLFYRNSNQVWVADVQTGSAFSAGKPRLVFERAGYGMIGPVTLWDISPDGRRFLMVKLGERKPKPVTEMILVQNWFEDLKRLARPK